DSVFTENLTPGTYDNRFVLVFKTGEWSGLTQVSTGIQQITNPKNIVIYSQQSQIFVNFMEPQQNITVQVCDIEGRQLYNQPFGSVQGVVSLGSNYALNNVYIIKVTGNSILKINKLVLQ